MPLATKVRTLTFENCKEYANHPAIGRALGSVSYFADLQFSWQRGSNEIFSGIICQYILKIYPSITISDTELAKIKELLNAQPRGRLGHKTPQEFFNE